MINEFGGNLSQKQINNIIFKNVEKYKLNYSHKKENRWNIWMTDAGMTLSFTLNKGLFIPSISGINKKTLTKFYSSNESDVDQWIKQSLKEYLDFVKSTFIDIDTQQEIEGYNQYMKSYYRDMKAIDDYYEKHPMITVVYEKPKEPTIEEKLEDTKETVDRLKNIIHPKTKKLKNDTPGQMTLEDFGVDL